ncbi:alpha-N-acetylglucosaminidase [Carboxylicivirga mesophila]|uniref:Alpha-N-acetylglucosaminidase n=1 Tax=Carboxylicivirga mesophila TaxID=1166478 RepID=A0ABS5KDX1_9BACT|nr:alpha-N-acetylglucosaminidase [Carboxylicivirga mesophila]MBS2212693.1 alpha-N-acetylglucosaminidase [Carboxylicivirga mesophila]
MKKLFIAVLMTLSIHPVLSSEVDAAYALLKRLMPERTEEFEFQIIPDDNGKDVFELQTVNEKLVVRGNSALVMAYGLHYYLRHFCNSSFSWNGHQLQQSGEPLPVIEQKVRKIATFDQRYYLNYCTFNYSMSFWDWQRWEKEIDWMALHGINLPLALVGQEAVWQNTLRRLNYTEDEITAFLPGPSYTGWWLLGNLESWGGPVSQEWIDKQCELQKKIVSRMKELGMQPVFQGFYGMVPNSLKIKHPTAKIHNPGKWLNFNRPGFLLPEDPLFNEVAAIYYEEQRLLYGISDYYQGDPFHEGGTSEGVNVTNAAKGIYEAMKANNPKSTWVLQAWGENPTRKLLKGIPKGKALVVDLYAEALPQWGGKASEWARESSFEGHNWVWSEIPNFGGQTGMTAKLDQTNSDVMQALKHPKGIKMKGLGATPEGIEQDAVIYDLLFDLVWENDTVDMDDWLEMYVSSRYGKANSDVLEAWQIMRKTVYNSKYRHASGDHGSPPFESVLCARPAWNVTKVSTWGYGDLDYSPEKLLLAWKMFFKNRHEFAESDCFRFDLVNLTRQVMANHGREVYQNLQSAFENKDVDQFNILANNMLDLISDMDLLMSSRKEFLLGTWLNEAKKRAPSQSEMKNFEENARRLITVWTNEKHVVNDYAYREYSGLLNDYYKERWHMFIEYARGILEGKEPNAPDFYSFEEQWVLSNDEYPNETQECELDVVYYLGMKYFN